jgi:transposase
LLPPDVREWLPADHLAWLVIDAVGKMDLEAFYAAYRPDGHGRAAYEPSVMVAVILYAFATNVRSARAIERHCRQDVAYRVITGNLVLTTRRSRGRRPCRPLLRNENPVGELWLRPDRRRRGLVR